MITMDGHSILRQSLLILRRLNSEASCNESNRRLTRLSTSMKEGPMASEMVEQRTRQVTGGGGLADSLQNLSRSAAVGLMATHAYPLSGEEWDMCRMLLGRCQKVVLRRAGKYRRLKSQTVHSGRCK